MTKEELVALQFAILDDRGHEIVNPKPTVERIKGGKPDLETRIKMILNQEFRKNYYKSLYSAPETDPDDFNIPDEEPLPLSGYEVMEDEVPYPGPGKAEIPGPGKTEVDPISVSETKSDEGADPEGGGDPESNSLD